MSTARGQEEEKNSFLKPDYVKKKYLTFKRAREKKLLSIQRCLWDTDNFTQEQLQCKASKQERERQENSTPKVYQKFGRFRERLSYSCNIERERE